MRDLHELPKLRDGLSYLYVEHCRVEQKQQAVEAIDKTGRTLIPAAALAVLLLGPGASITHAAVKALADNGCLLVWCGEDATRCYAQGGGETRKAYHLLRQAELVGDPQKRLQVVVRMYRYRFGGQLDPDLSLLQIRGMEGARVRRAYAEASRAYDVPWRGRSYDFNNWGSGDPVNRALSAANALLNGLCHTAIVSGGYSPALGFIHTGRQLSFVYDIADLYKAEITIPLAFRLVAESADSLHARVRLACREAFKEHRLLQRLLPDIEHLLDIDRRLLTDGQETGGDAIHPVPLWTPPADLIGATPDAATVETQAPDDARGQAHRARRQRAQEGLQSGWTVRSCAPDEWRVVTRADSPGYTIRQIEGNWQCDCPDFAKNGLGMCKHTAAVELTRASQKSERGA
jgi:CRISPR-associated protein Cas1